MPRRQLRAPRDAQGGAVARAGARGWWLKPVPLPPGSGWLVALTLAASAVLVTAGLLDLAPLAIVAKLVASTGFVALAIHAGALGTAYGRAVLAALTCSWLGDALLLGRSDTAFVLGLGAFLLAHVGYVVAFALRGVRARAAGYCLPVVGVLTIVAMAWLLPYVPAAMRLPVLVYASVISLMVAMAFGARGAGGPWTIPLGAALFYLSDLSVAAGQFVRPEFPNYVWGLPFYYAGQLLLASSVAVAGRRG